MGLWFCKQSSTLENHHLLLKWKFKFRSDSFNEMVIIHRTPSLLSFTCKYSSTLFFLVCFTIAQCIIMPWFGMWKHRMGGSLICVPCKYQFNKLFSSSIITLLTTSITKITPTLKKLRWYTSSFTSKLCILKRILLWYAKV